MTEPLEDKDRAELEAYVKTLEAEVSQWRARHSRISCILSGGRPKLPPGMQPGGLEKLLLALIDRCEAAERARDAALRSLEAERERASRLEKALEAAA